ncbi:hypothetical protein Pan216_55240 [Planctomycetes bacterium Pan216]|uniref:S-adenosylmethionine:diacylglycerol 3-amino-3-carboxypropyl transferase n=1 Tax=Kolteria novifilia TaxID=2527975 RepID=A0A518BCK7_9BACT|nr:hypothetical protein Pan216_55240 [Planctomycetes bacterium Pan216]
MKNIGDWFSGKWFNFVHGNNLVYNTCWEDPRLDRVALELGPEDNVLVITSAGCNALDYALVGPQHVYAVDMNPRQNALLELKISAVRNLDYEQFFSLFGLGRLDDSRAVYRRSLRSDLSPWARSYWDRRIGYFTSDPRRRSFYFRGTSGTFARLINVYIDKIAKVRDGISALLAAQTVEEQRVIYDELRDIIFTPFMRWWLGQDTTLSLVGVPRPQRQQVERHYAGGIIEFILESLEAVFASLPIHDNYFWRVYLTGEYSPECCPEYLRPENFQKLRDGAVDRVSTHTCSITDFLESHDGRISRYVLLDHMDWLSTFGVPMLQREWQAIIDKAAPNARLLWRSGGLKTDYVDRLEVFRRDQRYQVSELLSYNRDLAAELHVKDRVHTYGSFHIADLLPA